ncbi:MAG: hypothetical protein ACREC6_03875 [Hyphomicrobiaceae bacterium]
MRTHALYGLVGLAVLLTSTAADARECRWFGKQPFCKGRCPPGWENVWRNGQTVRVPCWTGHMRYCCKTCGPAQYGTPGCPYPSFGGKRR